MEVASRDNKVFVGTNGGVVGSRIYLCVYHRIDVAQGIFYCAMNLWHATERVGVLHVLLGARNELATFEQLAEACSRLNLSLMGTYCMYCVGERLNATIESIKRHGGDNVGPFAQTLSIE